jgi:hypothetical protein
MGKPVESFPSQFLEELPEDCLTASVVDDKDYVPDFASAWKKIAKDEG